MKNRILPFAVVTLIGAWAGNAGALCNFDVAPAKGVKASLIRAYAPCPGTEHASTNATTEGGTESCQPVRVRQLEDTGLSTSYNFSSKGKCSLKTGAKLLSDCSLVTDAEGNDLALQPIPCHVTYVKAKCKGILSGALPDDDSNGTPIGSGDDGWSLATLSRATIADAVNGDMTVIDFPVQFVFSTPSNGKMSVNSSSAEALKPLTGVNNADLPPCTSIETVDIIIKDPNGMPFARVGGATTP